MRSPLAIPGRKAGRVSAPANGSTLRHCCCVQDTAQLPCRSFNEILVATELERSAVEQRSAVGILRRYHGQEGAASTKQRRRCTHALPAAHGVAPARVAEANRVVGAHRVAAAHGVVAAHRVAAAHGVPVFLRRLSPSPNLLTRCGQVVPGAEVWPTSTRIGHFGAFGSPMLAGFDHIWQALPTSVDLGQLWSWVVQIGQHRPKLGQIRPMFAEIYRMLVKQPTSAN